MSVPSFCRNFHLGFIESVSKKEGSCLLEIIACTSSSVHFYYAVECIWVVWQVKRSRLERLICPDKGVVQLALVGNALRFLFFQILSPRSSTFVPVQIRHCGNNTAGLKSKLSKNRLLLQCSAQLGLWSFTMLPSTLQVHPAARLLR